MAYKNPDDVKIAKSSMKTQLLKELAKDFDLKAAAKRLNISRKQLMTLEKDPEFTSQCKKIINNALDVIAGREIEQAVGKFKETQSVLQDALSSGEYSVASALVKTHELEYRMLGLFEKDNKQKQAPVTINISLDQPESIQGDIVIDGKKL